MHTHAQPIPAHPAYFSAGKLSGGVAVLRSPEDTTSIVSIYDPLTDEPRLWAELPSEYADLSAPFLVTRQVLFTLFPEQQWYFGWPWAGPVEITVRTHTNMRAGGMLRLSNEDITAPWLAELAYPPGGPRWSYDLILWPEVICTLDVIFLGRVCAALHTVLESEQKIAQVDLNNIFTAPPLPFLDPPFLVAGGNNVWTKFGRRTGAV